MQACAWQRDARRIDCAILCVAWRAPRARAQVWDSQPAGNFGFVITVLPRLISAMPNRNVKRSTVPKALNLDLGNGGALGLRFKGRSFFSRDRFCQHR